MATLAELGTVPDGGGTEPGGNLGEKSTVKWAYKARRAFNRGFPLLAVAGYGYMEYIYSYRMCWRQLHRHLGLTGTAIALICVYNVIFAAAMVLWVQILVNGPGNLRCKVPAYDLRRFLDVEEKSQEESAELIEPPDWFLCDSRGLPFWCSQCQSIKILRSHHSTSSDHCVLRFDHFCMYLGCVIGGRNYKLFLQFLSVVVVWLVYIFVSTVSFVPRIRDYKSTDGMVIVDPNIIVLLVVSGFWILITGALFASHLLLINKNFTTVESMQLSTHRRSLESAMRYVNFKHPQDPSKRVVIDVYPKEQIYDRGFYSNLCQLVGTSGFWLLVPWNANLSEQTRGGLTSNSEQDLAFLVQLETGQFTDAFKRSVIKRFEAGEGFIFQKTH